MHKITKGPFRAPAMLAALLLAMPLLFNGLASAETSSKNSHAKSHPNAPRKTVYNGYFADEQVKPRALSDWEGDWQSVYPYLLDGTLDPVMASKAKQGTMSAGEYRAYYETGYKTDVDWIAIKGSSVSFTRGKGTISANYEADGHEILTYKKGNRGVRFIFRKTTGDATAPRFIQFSDHIIAPEKAGHFHLYWGEDRAALLKEVTNWPTYYPTTLGGRQIVEEMLAH